ncbi:MAG: porphobilinogen deaminase [Pycnora praestabilis]|nr:MAG: porphobilinogen deaminase [Pycnora praestabilis]
MASATPVQATPPPPTNNTPTRTKTTVNLGTRRSKLALVQTEIVHEALQKAWPEYEYEIHAMSTMGDKNQVTPLHDFGAKSLWTHELEALLMEGNLDLVVHCLKGTFAPPPRLHGALHLSTILYMPTQLPPTCTVGSILPRADPRDALVMKPHLPYSNLQSLPANSIVGTSSVRRSAQIKRRFPHLRFADVRGNVGTRLSKLDAEDGEYTCLVLAAAGLDRLGLGGRITQYLDGSEGGGGILHAVGQGALGLEIREGDERIRELVGKLGCKRTTLACLAERSLLRTLEGGCSVPIGVETKWVGGEERKVGKGEAEPVPPDEEVEEGEEEKLCMKAIVVSLDGTESVEYDQTVPLSTKEQADEFGWSVAQALVERGAGKILEKINLNRGIIGEQDGA